MKILLIVYDNSSYVHVFPIGLAYVAGVLKKAGHDVEIYSQDKFHYPEAHLTGHLDRNRYDMVGLSIIAGYYQYRKLMKISEAVNNSVNRPFYVLGGHGPSPEPEFFLRKTQADAVVIGEGEETVLDLVSAIAGRRPLRDIKGLAFREGDRITINERRPPIRDIDSIPFPAYELFPIDYYRLIRMPNTTNGDLVMSMISGRGCTFNCNFCYRLDKGFRPRSNRGIVEEIMLLKKDYGINYIDFEDELLMSSKERAVSLCEDIIRDDLKIKWCCNGRLNYAEPYVLEAMKRAGCVFINYGIESMDDRILKNMNKSLTTAEITKGVEATLASGISPGLNIIFGNIGEDEETLKKGVEFLLKYDDGAQLRTIRPVTPYPGSPLYYHAIEKGLLKGVEDFYETRHVNSDLLSVNFTALSDEMFHDCLYRANSKLVENYYNRLRSKAADQMKRLYYERDASFRGFRQS
jgi:radical SAM superfamily enzyme YgiQ (UPF0313 family)